MNAVLNREEVKRDTDDSKFSLRMPKGLLGFEGTTDFCLESLGKEYPFTRLQMNAGKAYTFYLIPVMAFFPDYNPEIDKADLDFLEIQSPRQLLMFAIVNLNRESGPTVNLKGPILINRDKWIGSQIVPINASELPTNQDLPNLKQNA
jgi:flagellar assembly factor FliW